MKNISIFILSILISILVVSCDKDDDIIVDEQQLITGNAISGNVSRITFGFDTTIEDTAREILVFLGQEYDDVFLDSVVVVAGEVFYGDGWYATRTDGEGNYLFDSIPAIEFAQIQVIAQVDSIEGIDITPDGDDGEELADAPINVSVEEGEIDDGNNFTLVEIEQLPTEISGQVSIDLNGDGLADEPIQGVALRLYRTDETGNPGGFDSELIIGQILTDSEGRYSVQSIEPGNYTVLFGDQDEFAVISSGDATPDADPVSPNPRYIPAFIDEDEKDSDNNFIIERTPANISGNIYIDGVDGIGAANQRVELYSRNDEGMPMAPLVASINTDIFGYFWFSQLDPDDYVLYFIGDGTYSCVSGEDNSPEVGEPSVPECFFIAVDHPTTTSEDSDNTFIVE